MAKPVPEQLLEAFEASDLTLQALLEKARGCVPRRFRAITKPPLDCDFTSLSRKLHGKQGMTMVEAQAIADALELAIDWGNDAEVAARVLAS